MASNKKFTVEVGLNGEELLKDMERVLATMSLNITKNKALTESFKSVAARLAGDFTRTFNESIKGLKVDFSFLEGATDDALNKSEQFLKITEAMTNARLAQLNVTIRQAKAEEAVANALIAQSKARQQVDREAGRIPGGGGTDRANQQTERNRRILENAARDLVRKAEADLARLAAKRSAEVAKELADIERLKKAEAARLRAEYDQREKLKKQAQDLLRMASADAKKLDAQKEADAKKSAANLLRMWQAEDQTNKEKLAADKKEMNDLFALWKAQDAAAKKKLADDKRIADEAVKAAKEKEAALRREMDLLRQISTQGLSNIQKERQATFDYLNAKRKEVEKSLAAEKAAAEKALQSAQKAEALRSKTMRGGGNNGGGGLTQFLGSRATQREGALGQLAAFGKTLGGGFGAAIAGAIGGIYLLERAFQSLFDLMADGTQKAIELSRAQYLLATAVRATQRVYGSEVIGSIRDYTSAVTELSQRYRIFTTKDLTEGLAYTINATRQFGLTRDQILNLTESIIVLSEKSGATFEDVASNAVSLMLGNSRALERFGIDASEEAFAQQAVMMGYKEAFNQLSLADKGLVRMAYLLKQIEPARADAVLAQETAYGRIQAATAQTENTLAEIGKAFVPISVGWEELKNNFIEGLAFLTTLFGGFFKGLYVELKTFNDEMLYAFLSTVAWTGDVLNSFGMIGDEAVKELGKLHEQLYELGQGPEFNIEAVRKKYESEYNRLQGNPDLSDVAKDPALAVSDVDEEEAKKFKDWFMQQWLAVEQIENDYAEGSLEARADYWKNYAEINKDYEKGIREAVKDYYDALQDAQDDFQAKSLEAWEDYQDKLADIATDNQQELEDLERERLRKLEDITTEQDDDRIKAEADLAKKLRDIEQNLQDKLQQIREQYAISIDEAVQKRDARAILNLQRRRAQEIGEAYRDYNRKRQDALEAYQKAIEDARSKERDRVAEIEKWYRRELEDQAIKNKRKQDEALKDYQRTLADLTKNLNAQNAQALKSYREQLVQLRASLLEQRKALNDAYTQQLADLKAAHDKKLRELTRAWAMENYVTESQANLALRILSSYFGLGGYVDKLMEEFIARGRGRVEIEVRASGIFAATQGAKTQSAPATPAAPAPPRPNAVPNLSGITPNINVDMGDRTPVVQAHAHTFNFNGTVPPDLKGQIIDTITEVYKELGRR